jgi:hypothetical protein
MLDLDYSTNIDDVIDRLTELEKKHVPYALSRTINRLTYEGRDVVIDQLPRRFTIREKSLKASGGGRRALWVKPNNKSQPVIQSEIGTPFWFLEDQEVGGTRRGKSGEGSWIPGLGARTRKSKEGRVARRFTKQKVRQDLKANRAYPGSRRSKRNKQGYAKQKPFVVDLGGGKRGVFVRQKKGKRTPLSLLWVVQDSRRIRPRWRFEKTMNGVVEGRMTAYFALEMRDALKTSRSGPKKSMFIEHLIATKPVPAMPAILGSGSLSGGSTLDQLSQVARGLPGV